MDVLDVMDKFAGISAELLNKWEGPVRNQVTFFKPFNSYSDAAFRVASVVGAPFVLALLSSLFIVIGSASLLGAAYYAMTMNFTSAGSSIHESFDNWVTVLQILSLAIASPFINLVDTVGAGVNTLKECINRKTDDSSQTQTVAL
ncbi:hypothetical protein [Legionella sp. W05-934-2]|jgi:hypothetical protein|uniref:hypothetical protein n=1 Tax=Legionella sp. W05-934-2 TaxID=1198649 RepID=UPI003461D837